MHLSESLDYYYKKKLLKLPISRAKPLKVTITDSQISQLQKDSQIESYESSNNRRNYLVPNWNNPSPQDFTRNKDDYISSKEISKKIESNPSERSIDEEASQFGNFE